jgi:hypothetical protein
MVIAAGPFHPKGPAASVSGRAIGQAGGLGGEAPLEGAVDPLTGKALHGQACEASNYGSGVNARLGGELLDGAVIDARRVLLHAPEHSGGRSHSR